MRSRLFRDMVRWRSFVVERGSWLLEFEAFFFGVAMVVGVGIWCLGV